MPTTVVETSGTVRDDGTLELDHNLSVPPGRVRVRVEALNAAGSATETRFRDLVRQWKAETEFVSSLTRMVTHPAYQQIIGMGGAALPLLLDELRREPDHWFWALRAITGEDPVAAEERGRLDAMTAAWLRWAEEHDSLLVQ
jgi:hypothetical protein